MTEFDQGPTAPVENGTIAGTIKKGKPIRKLVVLPGMDGTGKLLGPFVESLGPRVDVQLFDYPTDVIQTYEEIIHNVEAALPHNGENFVILGESFAGPITLALAQKGLPGLKGLILVVSFAKTPRHPLLPLTRALPMPTLLSMPVPRRFARRMMLGGNAPEGTLDKLLEVFYMISPEVT